MRAGPQPRLACLLLIVPLPWLCTFCTPLLTLPAQRAPFMEQEIHPMVTEKGQKPRPPSSGIGRQLWEGLQLPATAECTSDSENITCLGQPPEEYNPQRSLSTLLDIQASSRNPLIGCDDLTQAFSLHPILGEREELVPIFSPLLLKRVFVYACVSVHACRCVYVRVCVCACLCTCWLGRPGVVQRALDQQS